MYKSREESTVCVDQSFSATDQGSDWIRLASATTQLRQLFEAFCKRSVSAVNAGGCLHQQRSTFLYL